MPEELLAIPLDAWADEAESYFKGSTPVLPRTHGACLDVPCHDSTLETRSCGVRSLDGKPAYWSRALAAKRVLLGHAMIVGEVARRGRSFRLRGLAFLPGRQRADVRGGRVVGRVSSRCGQSSLTGSRRRASLMPLRNDCEGEPVSDTSKRLVEYQLLQIIPALPGTYALYEINGELVRDPVPAWGMWDATDGNGKTFRSGGPLVVGEVGTLVPAEQATNYSGIRIADCVLSHGSISFDTPSADVDPQKPRS